MKSEQIVSWLRDKAARAEGRDYRKMLTVAAEKIVELETELREEMHRHDRLQDFEVAEAEELRKARERNRWIPVSERLPTGECIACGYQKEMIIGYVGDSEYSTTGYAAENDGEHLDDVTHWMPLPEPPEEGTL